MSEQISGTHGRAEDDAIKRQDRSELKAYGVEWPEVDLAGEDLSDAIWAPEGRFARADGWRAIQVRSDLARHLDAKSFPASRARLLKRLTAHQAEDRLLDLVSSLPADTRVDSLGALVRALGMPVEERASSGGPARSRLSRA